MKSEALSAELSAEGAWWPVSTNIVRSICNPISDEEDLFDVTFTVFANRVTGDKSHNSVVLISEIQTSNLENTHMIAATTMQVLKSLEKAPDLADERQYVAFLKQALKLGSHVLWDYTVTYMRAIASGLHTPELRLPNFTAEPTLLAADGHTRMKASGD